MKAPKFGSANQQRPLSWYRENGLKVLAIIASGLLLAVACGTATRLLLGIEAVNPYAEQVPVDALGGLAVMLGALAIYSPIHFVREWRKARAIDDTLTHEKPSE